MSSNASGSRANTPLPEAEELQKKLTELKDELFHLRFQLAINQLDNPHKITEVKRDIARVLTVINGAKNA